MKIIVAISGASGSIYARQLIDALINSEKVSQIAVIMSQNGQMVYRHEMGEEFKPSSPKLTIYKNDDFMAPFASGSSHWDAMVVAPCSVGVLARVASGVSESLTTRAADVMLKERRKLIFTLRETPLNLIHIENMKTVTLAGAIVVPASPSLYSSPSNIEELCYTVTARVLSLLGVPDTTSYSWGESSAL